MLREEGFELTLASRTREKVEAAAEELGAAAVAADLAREEDCQRVVRAHADRFRRLDVLVNSAGMGIGARLDDISAKQWDLQLNVNLRAAFLVTRAALPLLREARGLVVNLSSIVGTTAAPALAAYGAAKAGLIALTRSINAEAADDFVRATAICPGFVDTPMTAWTGMRSDEMIQPADCAEIVRMLLRLSARARIPEIVVERISV